ncbi:MAG: ABC transporter substrate-binding protein, partial [Clostridiaceae bacterium]|nr:ABC transporter substrate-binding protein [Clostridiaceae bacterium]
MNKKNLALIAYFIVVLGLFSFCSRKPVRLNPKQPLTVTLWHNYDGQMQRSMNELIDEFNMTIGRDEGVIISVTAVAAMEDQEEQLSMITAGVPGAERMPDIFTAYPRT